MQMVLMVQNAVISLFTLLFTLSVSVISSCILVVYIFWKKLFLYYLRIVLANCITYGLHSTWFCYIYAIYFIGKAKTFPATTILQKVTLFTRKISKIWY